MPEQFKILVRTTCGRLSIEADISAWLTRHPERAIDLIGELRKEDEVSVVERSIEGTVWPMELKKFSSEINTLVNYYEVAKKFAPDVELETVLNWREIVRFYIRTNQRFELVNVHQDRNPKISDVLLLFGKMAQDGGDSLWRKAVASGATEMGKKEWLLEYPYALPDTL